MQPLFERNLMDKDDKTGNKPRLLTRIKELTEIHGATEKEMLQIYDHIMREMI